MPGLEQRDHRLGRKGLGDADEGDLGEVTAAIMGALGDGFFRRR